MKITAVSLYRLPLQAQVEHMTAADLLSLVGRVDLY